MRVEKIRRCIVKNLAQAWRPAVSSRHDNGAGVALKLLAAAGVKAAICPTALSAYRPGYAKKPRNANK